MWSLSFVAVLLLQCLLHCLGAAAAAAGVSTQFLQGPPIGNTCVSSLISPALPAFLRPPALPTIRGVLGMRGIMHADLFVGCVGGTHLIVLLLLLFIARSIAGCP